MWFSSIFELLDYFCQTDLLLEGMWSSKKRGVGGEKRKENNKEAIWEFMKNLLENLWCNFKWL